MTVRETAAAVGLEILVETEGLEREVGPVYCCDLLSFVMGRAPADCAWVTVMGNVNAMAVALLADMACVVLAENAALDDGARAKAEQNDIAVLRSTRPVFDTALSIHGALSGGGS